VDELTLVEATPWITSALMILAFVWKIYFQKEENELRHADVHVNASKQAVEALSKALEELQRQMDDARLHVAALQQQVDALKLENDRERERRRAAEQTAIEARNEIQTLREQLAGLSGYQEP